MNSWNEDKFYEFIIQNNVIEYFSEPIKLKSNKRSNWYINWRNVAEDVFAIDQLSDFVIEFVKDKNLKPDCFFGVPEGATKLGIITQYKWAKNQSDYSLDKYTLSMGRGQSKSHGDPKDQYCLGIPKGKIIVLEDVITTGRTIIETIKMLMNLKIEILAVICLTNRSEINTDILDINKIFKDLGIKLYAMSNASDIFLRLLKS